MTWNSLLCYLIIFYSSVHFWQTGFKAAIQNSTGDFVATTPNFLAWKINPKLIKSNPKLYVEMADEWVQCDIPQEMLKQVWQVNFEKGACQNDFVKNILRDKCTNSYPCCFNQRWHYGPVIHFATMALFWIDTYTTFYTVWLFVCYLLLALAMILWYRVLIIDAGLHSLSVFTAYFFIWMNFFPLYEALLIRACEIFELFLITLSFFWLSRKRMVASGIAMGFATMTKFFPILFIPYFIVKSRYRAALASIIATFIIAIISETLFGWKNNLMFSTMAPSLDSIWSYHGSQSLPSFVYRLFCELNFKISPEQLAHGQLLFPKLRDPAQAAFVSQLAKLVVLATVGFYCLIFFKNRKCGDMALEVAIILVIMLNLSNHNHLYYLMFLTVSFSIALREVVKAFKNTGKPPWISIAILGFAYLMLGVVFPMSFFDMIFSQFTAYPFIVIYQAFSVPVYGYLLLLGWLTWRYLWKSSTKAACGGPFKALMRFNS